MVIQNDPLKTMIKVTKSLYPEAEALIEFFASPEFRDGEDRIDDERFSSTTFPKDGDIPLIKISGNVPFNIMLDLLCTQLATAIVGLPIECYCTEICDCGYDSYVRNNEWMAVYSNIKREYNILMRSKNN